MVYNFIMVNEVLGTHLKEMPPLSYLQHKTAEPLSDAFLGIPNIMLSAVDTRCSGIAYSVV